MNSGNQPEHEKDIELLEDVIVENKIVVHNDYVNSFQWVIESLMQVCRHTYEQAEQCTLIIHNKGKYAVKHGAFDTLKPMKDAIVDRGINATIE